MNLVTTKAEAKHEPLFNKLASEYWSSKVTLQRVTKFIIVLEVFWSHCCPAQVQLECNKGSACTEKLCNFLMPQLLIKSHLKLELSMSFFSTNRPLETNIFVGIYRRISSQPRFLSQNMRPYKNYLSRHHFPVRFCEQKIFCSFTKLISLLR